MKILYINHEYPPIGGGGATACKNMSEEYVQLGNQVTVLTASYQNLPREEWINGVHILRVPCKRKYQDHSTFFEMLSYLLAAFREVDSVMQQEQFDVAHIFFGIPSGPLGLYLYAKYNLPYLIEVGGGDIPGAQKRFTAVYKIISPVLKQIWRKASHVVLNSQGLLKRAQTFSDQANFVVIPNGIKSDWMEKSEANLEKPSEIFSLCTTARIIEGKGIQHIIRLLPALAQKLDGKLHYTIIGDGPYRETLEEMARQLQVQDYLTFTGFLPHEAIPEILAQNDVFVFPSYSEGMANTVLEAMGAGLPVIMTSCEGSTELVTDNGFIVQLSENIEEQFLQKILYLYANPKKKYEMGKNGRIRAKQEFTWEKNAHAHLELFEEMIMSKTCLSGGNK